MSLILVETTTDQPLTDALLNDDHERVEPCFAARNVTWRYSLLSVDRHRMVCLFDAPDAESVREAYRRGGLLARPTWSGRLIELETAQPQQPFTVRHVIEGTYAPLSATDWDDLSQKILQHCAAWDMQWLQSCISLDRTKVIYELSAPARTPVQTASHPLEKLEIPYDRVWSAHVLSP